MVLELPLGCVGWVGCVGAGKGGVEGAGGHTEEDTAVEDVKKPLR